MIKVKIYGAGSIGNHLAHACRSKGWDVKESPISLEKGLDTMMVISAAYRSYNTKKTVNINYKNGYNIDAIEN